MIEEKKEMRLFPKLVPAKRATIQPSLTGQKHRGDRGGKRICSVFMPNLIEGSLSSVLR